MLVASQPRYGEGGEAIALKASCFPYLFHLPFPSYCDVAQARRYFAYSIRMGEIRNVYKIVVGKTEWKCQFGRR
jgi:hypothetical protein